MHFTDLDDAIFRDGIPINPISLKKILKKLEATFEFWGLALFEPTDQSVLIEKVPYEKKTLILMLLTTVF